MSVNNQLMNKHSANKQADTTLEFILNPQYVATHVLDKYDANTLSVQQCLVALGSNFHAENNLQLARHELAQLADNCQWSKAFFNPDYTATPSTPKPDYTNQCGYLILCPTLSFSQLNEHSKQIEASCQRRAYDTSLDGNSGVRQVSVDIDILAVKHKDSWYVVRQRYPFRAHEIAGIRELIENCV